MKGRVSDHRIIYAILAMYNVLSNSKGSLSHTHYIDSPTGGSYLEILSYLLSMVLAANLMLANASKNNHSISMLYFNGLFFNINVDAWLGIFLTSIIAGTLSMRLS